jgi:dihydroorotase
MKASEVSYDLVLTGARLCDPATGLDHKCDLAVNGERIAAVGTGLASHARRVIELDAKVVTAGWVDLHVHVFEWMTTFGLPPDDAGVHSGVTTAVDQGGAGAYTIPAFKHYIADRALTDIRCFPSINSAGTLRGGMAGPIIHTPEVVDVDLLVDEAKAHPRLVRGFGEIHAESGAFSRWGSMSSERRERLPTAPGYRFIFIPESCSRSTRRVARNRARCYRRFWRLPARVTFSAISIRRCRTAYSATIKPRLRR